MPSCTAEELKDLVRSTIQGDAKSGYKLGKVLLTSSNDAAVQDAAYAIMPIFLLPAAERGDRDAQHRVGVLLEQQALDYIEAAKWILISGQGKNTLEVIRSKISPIDMAEAERRAGAFHPTSI